MKTVWVVSYSPYGKSTPVVYSNLNVARKAAKRYKRLKPRVKECTVWKEL
jgi:hypothetical protein